MSVLFAFFTAGMVQSKPCPSIVLYMSAFLVSTDELDTCRILLQNIQTVKKFLIDHISNFVILKEFKNVDHRVMNLRFAKTTACLGLMAVNEITLRHVLVFF